VTLVTKFYQYWYDYGFSKVEALQKAQQDLITLGKKYAHPYYWAPFILLGNWF
jgi:CHAT domain-containing protein